MEVGEYVHIHKLIFLGLGIKNCCQTWNLRLIYNCGLKMLIIIGISMLAIYSSKKT